MKQASIEMPKAKCLWISPLVEIKIYKNLQRYKNFWWEVSRGKMEQDTLEETPNPFPRAKSFILTFMDIISGRRFEKYQKEGYSYSVAKC